jgi:hypothetical protein
VWWRSPPTAGSWPREMEAARSAFGAAEDRQRLDRLKSYQPGQRPPSPRITRSSERGTRSPGSGPPIPR